MPLRPLAVLLILPLLALSLAAQAPAGGSAAPATNARPKTNQQAAPGDPLPIEGTPVPEERINRLARELNVTPHESHGIRRAEIIFFISLPVMLWLTYFMMEGLVENVPDRNNPQREMKTPHYVFMLSSSLLTSFYIAWQDAERHPGRKAPPAAAFAPEARFSLPVLGIRF